MRLNRSQRLARRLAGVMLLAGAVASAQAGLVHTESGDVEGVVEAGVTVYKGIPFAAPPLGEQRWRAPQPVTPWAGIRRADRFSPVCVQKGAYPEDAPPEPMSEDCLYLNVWVPAGTAPDARVPVMVWIYGGGLQNGTASTPLYAGEALAQRGVVVVTANYRLGALGFLAHPDLTRESPNKVSGNYGLLDQIAALEWVKRNIASFGGDPSNTTVFGQSSGSISISVLAASPLAKGLFRRAIGQSGGLFEPIELASEFTLTGAEEVGAAFARRLGVASLEALRAKPAAEVMAAHFMPNAVVDGHVLREPPYDAYADGRANEVDLLIGSNAGEGYEFLGSRKVTATSLASLLREDFPSFIVSVIGPNTPADDQEALRSFVRFEGDLRFGWDMLAWARLHAGANRGRTFLYRFEHVPPGEPGARHGVEMAYVFGHPGAAWTEGDRALSQAMVAYWTNFARTGDPNGGGLPPWPEFAREDERALRIDAEIRAGALPNAADLGAIDRLYATVRFVSRHPYLLGAAALLLLAAFLVLAWRAGRAVSRRRRARKAVAS